MYKRFDAMGLKSIIFHLSIWSIFGAGCILRLVPLFQKPIWIDEVWSLYFAKYYSFSQLFTTAPVRNDNHPGLYYALIKTLLGLSDNTLVLRFISSLLPQVLAMMIVIIWGLQRKIPRLALALLTGSLAFSPFLISFAWELRMYSLTFLWTVILGILMCEYIFYGVRNRTIFLMIPVFLLAQATHVNGYLLTITTWLTVFRAEILNKPAIKTLRYLNWSIVVLGEIIISLLPYYPFHTGRMFDHASWILKPSVESAVRIYPLTVLGLDALASPASSTDVKIVIWSMIMTTIIVLALLYTAKYTSGRGRHLYIMSLFFVILVPTASYLFSHVSVALNSLPHLYKYIPTVSIFLPRFFLPQAVTLHVLIAVSLFYGVSKSNQAIRLLTACCILAFLVIWSFIYVKLNTVTANEKAYAADREMDMRYIKTTPTIFYPGYMALFLLDPSLPDKQAEVNNTYHQSIAFEEDIKQNRIGSYCQRGSKRDNFILVESVENPKFFDSFTENITYFITKFCTNKLISNSFATIHNCSCQIQGKSI